MRRAEVRTELADAELVAAALRPDNTEQMQTRTVDGAIVTTIERETTGGLRSTVDDYVVNLDVARRTIDAAMASAAAATRTAQYADRHGRTTNGDTTHQ